MSRFPMERIAIVMMTALGDTVHVLPVITALKRARPDCHITWILQRGPAMLVRGHPDVDDLVVFDKAKGVRGFLEVREAMRDRHIDLVLALQVYFKAGVVTALIDAPVKLGFDRARARDMNWLFTTHRIPPHDNQHVQDQYLEFLDYLGVPSQPVEWKLGPWPQERQMQRDWFAKVDRPVVPLVVGTSKPEKDWLPERWAELNDVLFERYDLQPVLVGGRSARELATGRIMETTTRHPPINELGGPLREMVAILDGAPLIVSLDTGPLHMAVALDRPVISLMGYNNPKRVGPYRKFHDLIVDVYGDPGEDYPITPAHRHDRMGRISVGDVVEKVELWQSLGAVESADRRSER